MKYRISNATTSVELGIYEADDELGALDAMARDAGYRDHAHSCDVAPVKDGEILVEAVADFGMTRADVMDAIDTGAIVEAGEGEDHDTGWIVELIDDDMALVSWRSGVQTPCPITGLRRV